MQYLLKVDGFLISFLIFKDIALYTLKVKINVYIIFQLIYDSETDVCCCYIHLLRPHAVCACSNYLAIYTK